MVEPPWPLPTIPKTMRTVVVKQYAQDQFDEQVRREKGYVSWRTQIKARSRREQDFADGRNPKVRSGCTALEGGGDKI